MRILTVIAILIAYGSLYPGNFSEPDADALKNFLTDWRLFTSRGDVIGNLALFFPLGMVGILFLPHRLNAAIHFAWLLFLALVFSFALQLAQIWLPSRSPALADVIWNMAGMVLGMISAYLIKKHAPVGVRSFDSASLAALSVLVLWLLTELLPLVPSLDWQKIKNALKPLFLDHTLSFRVVMMHTAGVMIAGSALVALGHRSARWLAGLLVLVMAGKLAIVTLTLDASILTGYLAGYLGFLVLLRLGGATLFGSAFWLLFAAWSITAIMPFSPAPGGTFNGIPFATMLRGSMEAGVRGLAQSLFIYAALLWLTQKIGIGIRKATIGLLIWSCLIELVQMGLLGRTADVTEPILVLLIGWVLKVTQSFSTPISRKARAPRQQPHPNSTIHIGINGKYALKSIAVGVALCTSAIWLIMQSPLTPYNVRELVYHGHPFRSMILLAVLLYWVIGFPVLMAQWLARGKLYLLSFPPLLLLHGLVAWILLSSSVPSESIHDIVGSPVLSWPWEWELLGRFLALFSFWSIAATAGSLFAAWHTLPGIKSALLGWIIAACVVIPVSYYIVVASAATDNLVELIAANGSIASFLLIGVAIAGVAFGGTKGALALIPGTMGRARAAAWALGSGVLVYLALGFGMEQTIVKYGQVFSALQFLLSSDREHLAGPDELLVRYAVLYGLLIAGIILVQYPLWRWVVSRTRQPYSHKGKQMPLSAARQ